MTVPPTEDPGDRPRLGQHRLVRAGAYSWSLVGAGVVFVAFVYVLGMFRVVVVPLIIALFPAALLSPLSGALKRRGLPPMPAAIIVVLTFLVGLVGILTALTWLVADELSDVVETIEVAYTDISDVVTERTGWTLPALQTLLDNARDRATGLDLGDRASTIAFTTLEILSGILLGIVTLFFYLKDGDRMAGVMLQLTPDRRRADVAEVMRRVWATLGGYFRGQLLVAAVDAVFIGLGLVVLRVPLALPLAVLVFFGGLFPIVGAFTAGAVAVLVALADGGIGLAAAVLALNVVVQQIEGNLLEPLIVGRATELHPLLVLGAVTAGGVTLGILGAFLAVPVTAAVVRAVTFVLEREPSIAVEPGAAVPRLEDVLAADTPAPPTPAEPPER